MEFKSLKEEIPEQLKTVIYKIVLYNDEEDYRSGYYHKNICYLHNGLDDAFKIGRKFIKGWSYIG